MALSREIPDVHAIVFPAISTEPHQPRNFNFLSGSLAIFRLIGFRSGPDFTIAKMMIPVYCHTCVKVFKELNMSIRNAEDAFISRGFSKWKLATSLF